MTPIERVARAMFAQAYADATDGGKASMNDPEWLEYVSQAKAAIAAMMEPSEAMVDAGDSAANQTGRVCDVWRDMVEAALDEG